MRRLRLIVVLLGALIASASFATMAWAYFTSTGAGTAATVVATLSAPTNVLAATTVPAGTVHVSWTASTPPAGATVDGYYVERLSGPSSAPACGTAAVSLTTVTSCDDLAVPDGFHSYRVTAVLRSWTAQSSPSNLVTVDATAPAVTLTTPANGATVATATPALSGAAGAATGDSNTVTVTIYNGTGTAGTAAQTLPVTRSGATWSTTAATLANGTYTAQATQTDAAGNTGTSSANTFTVFTNPLTITNVVRSGGNKKVSFTGTGGTSSATVTVTICLANTFPCTVGNSKGTATATVAANGSWTTGQSTTNLDDGVTYFAQAVQGTPAKTSASFSFTVTNLT